MSLRIVLNAEGAGETRGAFAMPPSPGSALSEEHLGPGHLLVRRLVEVARGVPANAVSFLAPPRSGRGIVVRGSMLLDRTMLRQLLQWPLVQHRPDVAIVLVDADGDPKRRALLESHVEGIKTPTIIAVAVQEFESWLITDQRALNAVVGASTARPSRVEELKRREAKELLSSHLAEHADAHAGRCTLARTIDLELLTRESESFARFVEDLRPRP
jgi:hypothetical protein